MSCRLRQIKELETMKKTTQLPTAQQDTRRPDTVELLPLDDYDRIFVAFSGGKDSGAMVFHLLDQGVPRDKMVLLHHDVDGAPGSPNFMDWKVTRDYVREFGRVMGIEVRFSWREGGFLREMMRDESRTAPISFEELDDANDVSTWGGTTGPLGRRMKFPQMTADLKTRYCSASLKIDVSERFLRRSKATADGGRFLLVTGERREESPARSRYAEKEAHKTTTRNRRVDQWRPVIDWTETEVWAAWERYDVRPHVAYFLGWGRLSCETCVFASADQWASVRAIHETKFDRVADLEEEFETTISRNGKTVRDLADEGTPYDGTNDADLVEAANDLPADWMSRGFTLPLGAYGDQAGPS
jgi:3'-phosphoadenosine 5'-phosphosulfate sulfotransferase (PAPS reductase)/FAD synthetase